MPIQSARSDADSHAAVPSAAAAAAAAVRERLEALCRPKHALRVLPSGHGELDASLPGGGWPLGAITELLSDTAGLGELGLLLPALAALAADGRFIVWIEPPYLPYAPALLQRGLPLERVLLIRGAAARDQEALWATEQALRCPSIGAVLGWSAHIVDRSLRRLQLAAETGGTLGILHRPAAAAREPSPAALRLQLAAAADGLRIDIHKARGGRGGQRLHLGNLDAVAVRASAGTAA